MILRQCRNFEVPKYNFEALIYLLLSKLCKVRLRCGTKLKWNIKWKKWELKVLTQRGKGAKKQRFCDRSIGDLMAIRWVDGHKVRLRCGRILKWWWNWWVSMGEWGWNVCYATTKWDYGAEQNRNLNSILKFTYLYYIEISYISLR